MRTCTAEEFLKDVATHRMTIEASDGVRRHILFKATKNKWNQWFEIVTWPGTLVIHGDMGSWTFSRVEDMFTFFRARRGALDINESYWADKLEGGDSSGSRNAMQFDADAFRDGLLMRIESCGLDPSGREYVARELTETLSACDGNEHAQYEAAYNFRCEVPGYGAFTFDGSDMGSGNVYRYRFIWCLYAIVWGIHKFDWGQGAELSTAEVVKVAKEKS